MTVLSLLVLVCTAGCVRRDGRNADCRWPGEAGAKTLDLSQPWHRLHLGQDAEFAEDLGIRHADTHDGVRSGHFKTWEAYAQTRDACFQAMSEEIGKAHGVTSAEVFEVLGVSRLWVDLAVNLPFILLYGFAASMMARHVWRRHPAEDGWMVGGAMVVLYSVVFGVAGVLLGDIWSTAAESIRIGTGHLSYRAARLPWARHQGELFAFTVVLFWFLAVLQYWRVKLASADRTRLPV